MKKNIVITISIIALAILIIFIFAFPKFLHEYEIKSNKIVINNCKNYVDEAINFDNKTLEESAKVLIEKFNANHINPISKKNNAYYFDFKCEGCVNIEYIKETNSLDVTGYDKDLKILCRTLVQPPSYVTYERED